MYMSYEKTAIKTNTYIKSYSIMFIMKQNNIMFNAQYKRDD